MTNRILREHPEHDSQCCHQRFWEWNIFREYSSCGFKRVLVSYSNFSYTRILLFVWMRSSAQVVWMRSSAKVVWMRSSAQVVWMRNRASIVRSQIIPEFVFTI